MASVSDVPYIPRNEMSFCSCHILSVRKALFTPEKVNIDLFQEAESTIIQLISITSCGPTPFQYRPILEAKKAIIPFITETSRGPTPTV